MYQYLADTLYQFRLSDYISKAVALDKLSSRIIPETYTSPPPRYPSASWDLGPDPFCVLGPGIMFFFLIWDLGPDF